MNNFAVHFKQVKMIAASRIFSDICVGEDSEKEKREREF